MRREVALALLRVALMTALQYRASFLLELMVGVGTTAGVALPLVFVYEHTSDVAGWNLYEAMLVGAFFLILQGLVGSLIEPNLGALVEGVRSGQLDYLLLKPADAQFAASFQRVAFARVFDALGGVAVGGWALSHLPPPTLGGAVAAAVLLVAGFGAVYGLWILVVCTSFWFVRVDNLRYLLGAVVDAGRWPVTVYTGWVRVLLTVFIPIALVTSYPAMALLGRMNGWFALQALGVSVGMVLLSRWVWLRALGHYTSASS